MVQPAANKPTRQYQVRTRLFAALGYSRGRAVGYFIDIESFFSHGAYGGFREAIRVYTIYNHGRKTAS